MMLPTLCLVVCKVQDQSENDQYYAYRSQYDTAYTHNLIEKTTIGKGRRRPDNKSAVDAVP